MAALVVRKTTKLMISSMVGDFFIAFLMASFTARPRSDEIVDTRSTARRPSCAPAACAIS